MEFFAIWLYDSAARHTHTIYTYVSTSATAAFRPMEMASLNFNERDPAHKHTAGERVSVRARIALFHMSASRKIHGIWLSAVGDDKMSVSNFIANIHLAFDIAPTARRALDLVRSLARTQ